MRVVFTLRDDFLGRLAEGQAARKALSRVTVLRSPGPEALREIQRRIADVDRILRHAYLLGASTRGTAALAEQVFGGLHA